MKLSLDYVAGFCDGDGCFTISIARHRRSNDKIYVEYKPMVLVSNTNRKILEDFKKTFKAGSIYLGNYDLERVKKNGWKTRWNWVLNNRQATEFCSIMLNKLIIKRAQAEILIKLQSTRSTRGKKTMPNILKKQKEMFKKIRKLNKRGID